MVTFRMKHFQKKLKSTVSSIEEMNKTCTDNINLFLDFTLYSNRYTRLDLKTPN